MSALDFASLRMRHQLLTDLRFDQPEEVVRWLVAVQSQDVYGALWALGQRLPPSTETAIGAAFDEGRVLRTHLLRPTWHFVHPEDIRWLLALTGPRVHRANAGIYRREGLDERVFKRAHSLIEKALRDKQYKTRDELAAIFAAAGLPATGLALAYIMMHSELEGLVASGPRRGKQFTYALLDERAPAAADTIDPEEVLVAFVQRYFASRGPATVADMAHWSGLTQTQVRRGLEAAKRDLSHETIEGRQFWFTDNEVPTEQPAALHLLPNYDEYGAAYKYLGEVCHPALEKSDPWDYSFSHMLLLNGQIIGSWRRRLGANEVEVELRPVRPLSNAEMDLLEAALTRYADFVGVPVRLA